MFDREVLTRNTHSHQISVTAKKLSFEIRDGIIIDSKTMFVLESGGLGGRGMGMVKKESRHESRASGD